MALVARSQGVRKEHSAERKESLIDEEMTALTYICSGSREDMPRLHLQDKDPLTDGGTSDSKDVRP